MATIKQQQAVEKIVESRGNVTQAMREAGYSEASIHNPSSLTSSKGYKQLLADCGLTENLVTKALVADIKAKKEK